MVYNPNKNYFGGGRDTWNWATGKKKGLPTEANTLTGEQRGFSREELEKKDLLKDLESGDYYRDKPSPFEANQGPDPSTFDVSDPEQVKAFQQQMVDSGKMPATYVNRRGETVSSVDAQFGPDTKKAWQSYVDRTRMGQGKESYAYDDNPLSAENLQGKQNLYDMVSKDITTESGTGVTPGGAYIPDYSGVAKTVEDKTAAGDYSGEADTSVGGAFRQTVDDYKDVGRSVYDWFSKKWND